MNTLKRITLGFIWLTLVSCQSTTVESGAKQWTDVPAYQQAQAIADGRLTSEALVRAYLARIEQLDGKLHAVLALNPHAIADAKARDAQVANGEALGPLHGLPVLLKDNIESAELPTTAGSLALADNLTGRDAPLVAKLRAAGAIILGKTNLSEWANFRSEMSISGWSGVGGLTRNPYVLTRSACGSSSGSAVAMAAHLASLAVGTETNGSVICPSSMNGIVGLKPTVGLVSRRYIVPLSFTQDTAGPMAGSVMDVALMVSVMAGKDADDPVTMSDTRPDAITTQFANASLSGLRIGVVRYRQGEDPRVLSVFNASLKKLQQAGATLVDIHEFTQPESFWDDSYQVLLSEFGPSVNAYLQDSPADLKVRSLADLIAFNTQSDKELVLFNQDIFEKSLTTATLDSDQYKHALKTVRTASRERGIDYMLEEHKVDILIAPSNNPAFMIDLLYGDHSPAGFIGIGYLAAIGGYPQLTLPMGLVHGLPVGISVVGSAWQDNKVLQVGYAIEQALDFSPTPTFAENDWAVWP